ncbi:MAG: gliding motility-associated C-terminal domain-containing protein [Tenuifilaceae bacterium]
MKRIITLLVTIIVSGFVLIPNVFAQNLVPKINNKTQAELTIENGCVGTDIYFIGSVQNLPPLNPVTYPTPRWTGSGSVYLDNVNANIVTFNCPLPGDYQITYSAIEGGITYSITQSIKVLNKDVITLLLPASTPHNMCEGSSVTLQASGTIYYYWERELLGGPVEVAGSTATIVETPSTFGTWTYRVYGSNDGCPSDPDKIEFQVIVDEAPIVNANGPYQTCSGVGVALNGSIGGSASSAQWIGGAGTFAPDRDDLNATYTPHASEAGTDVTLILRTDDPAGVCSFAESSTTLTVHSLPTVTLSAFSPVCIDLPTFALSGGSPAGGTYTGPGVAAGNFDPAAAGAGTHTITYTYTDGNGCINFATQNITVNALPIVTFGGVLTAQCLSSTTYTLTGGNPGGGSYSGTGVTGANFNASVAGVGNHIITYTFTDVNGCTSSATNTITVNALPVVTLGAFADICVNAPSFALSGGNPLGGTYSGPGVSGGNFTPLTAGVGTHTITYTYTDGNGCTNSATNTIKVNDKPTVTLSAFSPVCIDLPAFALSGGSPAGGTYSGTGVAGGNFNPATAGAGTHTITYSYTDGFGCANTATNTITVNALPIVTFGGVLTAQCLSSTTYTLTGGNPGGGSYSGTGVTGTNFNASVAGVGNHTITYTFTDANGCTSSATNTITVNALPVVTLGAFADICVNAPSFALSGGNPLGGIYSGPGVSGGNFTPLTAGVGTHTITYTYTDGNGCTNFATNSIKVNDKPTVTLSAFSPVCIDLPTFALSGGSPAGGTYSGTGVAGGNFNPATAGAGTHTITYSYTDGFGCANTATNTITVNALPVVTLGAFSSVCINTPSYALSGGSPAGGSYSGLGVSGGNFTPATAGVGTHTITYTYTNPTTGCTNSATNSITVNALPVVTFVGVLTSQCLSSTTYALTGGNPAGGAYSGTGVTGTNFNASGAGVGTHTITYTYTNPATGCSNSATNSITVYALPVVTFTGTLATQCESSTIYGLTGGSPVVGVYSGSGVTGTNFNASVAGVATHTLTYAYTDGNGCSNSATNTITVNPLIGNNTISAAQAICYNSIPAQLTGTVPTGGSGTYTYKWQSSTAGVGGPFADIPSETNPTHQPIALLANTWYRRIVSSNVCSDNTSNVIEITVGPVFTVGFTTTSPLCVGAANGTATANPVGGTPGYSYSWNTTPVQATKTATGLIAGTYTVTVTDNIGCIITGDAVITDPTPVTLGIPTINNVTGCFGGTNGSILIQAAGGSAPYTYSLFLGGAFQSSQTKALGVNADFTNLGASNQYEIRVSDANSCGPVSSGILTVTEPAELIISNVATTPISCAGSTDGTITVTASGGTGVLEYSADGVTYQPGNVLNVGEGYYDIAVRDVNMCTTVWPTQIVMVEPSEISFNYEITNITTCNGDLSGKITISNVSGGSGSGYEYSIYVPEVWGTNPNFINLPGGLTNQYYIKVRDSHGCIKVGNNGNPITINQPGPITYNVVTTNVTTCWYNTNGSIRINTVLGGTGSKTVSIDNITYYPTTKVFAVGVGSYTVYVKDANGCIAQKPATITGPPPIVLTGAPTVQDITCFGGADGEFHAVASGGTGVLTYSIDGITYFATGDFVGLSAGNYTLSVKDGNNCIFTYDFSIAEPPALDFTSQSNTDITCNGLNNGTITLVGTGGTAPYNYSITGGAPFANATGLFTGLTGGTYTAAIEDSRGCTATGNIITIINPALLSITSSVATPITCFGVGDGEIDVVATGGTLPLTYTLLDASLNVVQTNATGAFINVGAGTYTVSVNDVNSCGALSTGPLAITEPTLLTLSFLKSDLSCNGDASGEILLTGAGGTPPYEYSIDNGVTFDPNDYYTGLAGGTYNTVVRDSRGCEATQTVTLDEPTVLTISLTGFDLSCAGVVPGDGRIIATSTGGTVTPISPKLFRLDGGAWNTTGTFNNVAIGLHNVDVLDARGCIASGTITINEPLPISILTSTFVDPTCTTKGSITVTASGGTGTLSFTLNPGAINNTTGIFNNLDAGTYTVSVTDINNCGPTVSAPITIAPAPVITISNVTVVDVTGCFGGNNGSITITASGGTGALTYSIDGGLTNQPTGVFTGLLAGNYSIVVNDAVNCPSNETATVNQPTEVIISNVAVVQMTAPGANDGSITVTATGGTGPLTYTLFDALSVVVQTNGTGVFLGLADGSYRVRVEDAIPCFDEESGIIISGMAVTITANDVSCFGGNDGFFDVQILGGLGPFTIVCTPAGVGTFTYQGLIAGNYTIEVTDNATGNKITNLGTITQPLLLTAALNTITDPLCFGAPSGKVLFDIAGGTAPYTITWTGGTSNGNEATGVASGTHDFTITDSKGCTAAVNSITLADPVKLNITNITQVNPVCNGAATGSITVTAAGGTGALDYSVTGPTTVTGNLTGILENLLAGDYTVTVIDANSCVAYSDVPLTVTITEPTAILVTALTPDQPLTCPNVPEGFVRLQVSGGTPDYTYLWSNGQQTPDLTDIVSGDYTVTITDAAGCTMIKTITVDGPQMLTITSDLIHTALCFELKETGDDTGGVEILSTIGGTGTNLTYSWNYTSPTGPVTGPILSKVSSGTYTVTITDEAGCTYDFDYIVPFDPAFYMEADIIKDTTICYGQKMNLVAVNNGPLNRTYTYNWYKIPETSGTSLSINSTFEVTPLLSAQYYLEIRNDGGCFSNDTVDIGVFPNIGLYVPPYISAVKDTIISILSGTSYDIDVNTLSTEYETTFTWEPAILFTPSDSWNSALMYDNDLRTLIPANRIVELYDPVTRRTGEFILVDIMATTSEGCKDSLRLYTKLVNRLSFGNVFSPNGDGLNDVWRVPKDYLFPDLEIEVFNRWGALVWSASGAEAGRGWDGKTSNGKVLPIGTYYYVIKYNINTTDGKWKPITGSITIVR